MKKYVIIPSYQPDGNLYNTVKAEFDRGYSIIAVDDGSGEKYKKFFDDIKDYAEVLTHVENMGKGAAIKTAVRRIRDICGDSVEEEGIIGVMDSDGQHLPDDMDKVLFLAEENKGCYCLGAREINKKMPWKSRFGNSLTRGIFRLVSGVKVSDTQTGLRAFDISLCSDMISVPGNRYEYETNTLLYAAKKNIPIKEVKIETVYHDNRNTCSHFRAVKDSIRIYKDILKFTGSSLFCFLIDYGFFNLFLFLFRAVSNADLISNISARIISSTCNYFLNCKLVFGKKSSTKSLFSYFALAVFILVANTLLLKFYEYVGVPVRIAKLVTEITLFLISFLVQKLIIFKNKKNQ